jgi:hypothetical protein
MKAGLIGLPRSGKSTVFAAATGVHVDPYAASEVRHGIVRVPEPRLEYLTRLHNPKKVTQTVVEFIDFPGCSLDDPKGQDELRRMLPTIRLVDLLVVVVREFPDPAVPAHRERINPEEDVAAVLDEFVFADLYTVTTRIERIEAALRKPTRTHEHEKKELALLQRCRQALESNEPISGVMTGAEDERLVSSFAFLTHKPVVCVCNVGDDQAGATRSFGGAHVRATVTLSAAIEAEIATLDPSDRGAFLKDLGLAEAGRDRLIRTCYEAAGLISFLTMGPDEVRAWSIPRGATAVEAAAKIHTDLAHGFIRAETVSYDDLVANGDMKGARAAGKVRKEGKTYIVADGDILNILSSA